MMRLQKLYVLLFICLVAGCGGSSPLPTRAVGTWVGSWKGTLLGLGTSTYPMILTITSPNQVQGTVGQQTPGVVGLTGSISPGGNVALQVSSQDQISPAVVTGIVTVNATNHMQGTLILYNNGKPANQGNIDLTRVAVDPP